MTEIKARPTTYNGIRMRSRLEADYAAWLNMQGLRWEYEPECFANSDGQWLPDFGWTFADEGPLAVFAEVKPSGPLRHWMPGSLGYFEHVDDILRRMTIAWSSRPDACLCLAFWEYGGGRAYLELFSNGHGKPWMAEFKDSPCVLLWPGMGQSERLRDG